MAEEGWTQGVCPVTPGFASLLIPALERLGVPEHPRYYSREYEHHGTQRCRVVIVVAKSDLHPVEAWRTTATGFRHQDTYPLALRKALRFMCGIFERHLVPTC
jgi:hypothetical protein